jgi:hypothetical protein
VVTLPALVISLITLFSSSATYKFPLASKVMFAVPLNLAAVPAPFNNPAVPVPAMVVTATELILMALIKLFPKSPMNSSPLPAVTMDDGKAKLADVPVPLVAPAVPDPENVVTVTEDALLVVPGLLQAPAITAIAIIITHL